MLPERGEETDADGAGDCAAMRLVLDRIGDRWSLVVVVALRPGPLRFNRLRRHLDGVSQRMLTLTLRNLERDGLISRTIFPGNPVGVEYALTALGESLYDAASDLLGWAIGHRRELADARQAYDRAVASPTGANSPGN